MNILISGGAGFIGGHTADALVLAGHNVRLLDNLTEPVHRKGVPSYSNDKVELMVGDVRNKVDWEEALQEIDVVFHFAAYQDYLTDFSKFFHVNSVGTSLLYEVIVEKQLPVQKVVVASSQAVYGEGLYLGDCGIKYYPNIRSKEQLQAGEWNIKSKDESLKSSLTNEVKVNPQNQYAVSKYTQELISLSLGKRYRIPTVCMRYSIVQGPRQSLFNAYSGACRIFSLSYFHGQQPIIYEDGLQIRDFVNIQDVVAANLLVMEDQRADHQVFSVGGGGQPYTVLEFARLAAEIYGQPFEPVINGEFRFGDTRHIFSDITKLRRLGWQPKRDARYSLSSYKKWLESQDAPASILKNANEKMRETNVIGIAKRKS